MIAGPVLSREFRTAPRRLSLYGSRAGYVTALWLLMWTAWLIVSARGEPQSTGDLARFGASLFQILAPLQMGLASLFSALLAASAVTKEKDRRTLVLLLMTNLSNSEVVLGKLISSLLVVLVMLIAAIPFFLLTALLGGVSFAQISRVMAVTMVSALAAGSLGSTMALAREKTFQALALTALVLVGWTAGWELIGTGILGDSWGEVSASEIAAAMSPWQAILVAARPSVEGLGALAWLTSSGAPFLATAVVLTVLLNGLAIWRLRIWNPSREIQPRERKSSRQSVSGAPLLDVVKPPTVRSRQVWDYAILWREVRTWAYGRKVIVIRVAYVLMVVAAAMWLHQLATSPEFSRGLRSVIPPVARPLAPLLVLGWVLINALAVTSMTNERDARTLDLLLATDLSPKEVIFGKLGGVLYNSKEMILAPMLLGVYLYAAGALSLENLLYLVVGMAVMDVFVATLGIHVGMTYANSRTAVGVSLGAVLFLFVGVATCIRLIIAFGGTFEVQLQPFLAFMFGGGVGLYAALGSRNHSPAIALASFTAPLATFYIITSFILGWPLAVFLVTVVTYSFATLAMLVPAIYEFDVATGRTSTDES